MIMICGSVRIHFFNSKCYPLMPPFTIAYALDTDLERRLIFPMLQPVRLFANNSVNVRCDQQLIIKVRRCLEGICQQQNLSGRRLLLTPGRTFTMEAAVDILLGAN